VPRNSEGVLWDPPPRAADQRLAYGPGPKQFGDLRAPDGPGPFPLAIVVHGGFWKAQYNLIHAGHMCEVLRGEGIATWNVEYRAVGDPGGGWPGTAEDVFGAVEFAQELGFGSSVLVGHSAGGQLALLAAKRARLPVVALAAVTDMTESARRVGADSAAAQFVGATPDDAPELYAEASPIEQLPLGVPQTLIHGTADDDVPFGSSERYAAAAGGEATLIALDSAGHFDPIDPLSREWPQTLAAVRALLS
jgi:acetyl esterase/lipase